MATSKPKTHPSGKRFITEMGSVYTLEANGMIRRLRQGIQECISQTAIVFIPDYETVKKAAPPSFDFVAVWGSNETEFQALLLQRVYAKGARNYIVDQEGHKLNTQGDIQMIEGALFLTFGSEGGVEFMLPVFREPTVGFFPFDTSLHSDPETGRLTRARHLGHKVIEID